MEKKVDCRLLDSLIKSKFKTRLAFAAAAGVSRQYVTQILKGQRSPSLSTIIDFAALLEVTVDDLLIEVEAQP